MTEKNEENNFRSRLLRLNGLTGCIIATGSISGLFFVRKNYILQKRIHSKTINLQNVKNFIKKPQKTINFESLLFSNEKYDIKGIYFEREPTIDEFHQSFQEKINGYDRILFTGEKSSSGKSTLIKKMCCEYENMVYFDGSKEFNLSNAGAEKIYEEKYQTSGFFCQALKEVIEDVKKNGGVYPIVYIDNCFTTKRNFHNAVSLAHSIHDVNGVCIILSSKKEQIEEFKEMPGIRIRSSLNDYDIPKIKDLDVKLENVLGEKNYNKFLENGIPTNEWNIFLRTITFLEEDLRIEEIIELIKYEFKL